MSFGFGTGDFLTVGQLVLKLYNACRDAPGEFKEISAELSSIHTVLCGLAEQARDPTSLLLCRGGDRGQEWSQIRENLERTLGELQDIVNRYQTMGRNAWRRLRLALENLSDFRSKLGFHFGVINTFVGSLSLSALGRMEPVLGRIEILLREPIREERAGYKAPTVLTARETNDTVSWKQVEMDLMLEGIPREAFERNRDRVRELLDWVVSNESDLAELREVEPGDSVSCFFAQVPSNPFNSLVGKQHSSALSTIDEIFGPSLQVEPDFERIFNPASSASEKGQDVFWETLDSRPSEQGALKAILAFEGQFSQHRSFLPPLGYDPLHSAQGPSEQRDWFEFEDDFNYEADFDPNRALSQDDASTIGPKMQLQEFEDIEEYLETVMGDGNIYSDESDSADSDSDESIAADANRLGLVDSRDEAEELRLMAFGWRRLE